MINIEKIDYFESLYLRINSDFKEQGFDAFSDPYGKPSSVYVCYQYPMLKPYDIEKTIRNVIEVIKDYKTRIYFDSKKKNFFYIFVYDKKTYKIDTPIIDEYYFINEISGRFDFKSSCYESFINYGIADILNSLQYSDDIQIKNYYYLFSLFTVDKIIFKNKREMVIDLLRYSQPRDIFENNFNDNENFYSEEKHYIRCLGLYVRRRTGYKEERIVELSYELIERCYKHMVYNELFSNKYIKLNDFINCVFFHELGHNAYNNPQFDNLSCDYHHSERCANYFASYILSGKFDREIYNLTILQPNIYRNPLLLSNRIIDIDYDKKEKKMWR